MFTLLTRDQFRGAVLTRDKHRCVVCGTPGDETNQIVAHHIIERRLFPDGGYYVENGASVCDAHHRDAESTALSCDRIRELCGITKFPLPPHVYPDQPIDKWGNPILPNGTRLRGELFDDPSVQKVLEPVLALFTTRIKYPRTFHLPWSPGLTNDDRLMPNLSGLEGEPVTVMVKLDGECLAGTTEITMADGSRTRIRDLVESRAVGQLVLGVDDQGRVTPTPIVSVFNHGPTDNWLRIKTKQSHGPFRTIYCTPEHKFYVVDQGYVSAHELRPHDRITTVNETLDITPLQEQVLLGSLLGDGSLHTLPSTGCPDRRIAHVQVGHKKEYEAYLQWTSRALGNLARGTTPYVSGFGTPMLKLCTASLHSIYAMFASMIVNDIKTVPAWVIDQSGPIALAFWAMDDGSLGHSKEYDYRPVFQFSVCGFSEKDCEILREVLRKFAINSTLHTYDYRYLRLSPDDTERLAMIIAPYVPAELQYKLPESFRGAVPWLPQDRPNSHRSWIRESCIVEVGEAPKRQSRDAGKTRYDLETGTHNYFANNTLVHNCTTMYPDYLHARSIDYEHHPSRSWVRALHARIAQDIPAGWRICGENLYAKHAIHYQNLDDYFQLFSVWDASNTCLSWADTLEWAGLLGLRTVPVIWSGVWDEKAVSKLYTPTFGGDDCEGYVVRVSSAFHYREFRRRVGKYVRKGHVAGTHGHWARVPFVRNNLG